MSKSWKRNRRDVLATGGVPVSPDQLDLMAILADIIEGTPNGQRTPRMRRLLTRVRAAEAASPEP